MKQNRSKPKTKHPLPPGTQPHFTQELLNQLHLPPSRTDPQGWYTGVPADKGERPTQDADDL